MQNLLKHALSATAVAMLVACGGGGDGDDITPSNPIAIKYVGTYNHCDGDHTKYTMTLTDGGNGKLNAIPTEVTYQNSNCTGSILATATYSESKPTIMTFTGDAIVTTSAPGFPSSTNLDTFSAATPSSQINLTGPGVRGNCVYYPPGRFCYDLNVASEIVNIGFQKTDNGFHAFTLDNGIYHYDNFFVKQ